MTHDTTRRPADTAPVSLEQKAYSRPVCSADICRPLSVADIARAGRTRVEYARHAMATASTLRGWIGAACEYVHAVRSLYAYTKGL